MSEKDKKNPASDLSLAGIVNLGYDTETKASLIDRTHWASEFSYKQITIMARYMGAYEARKDRVIFRESDTKSFMCLIAKGRVAVWKGRPTDGHRLLTQLGAGQTFGEMALIDEQPRSASVTASEDTILLILTREGLDLLCKHVPEIGVLFVLKLARLMSQRIRSTSGALVEALEEVKP